MAFLFYRKEKVSHFVQLIRHRWDFDEAIDPLILKALEIDVICHYLADKPVITDPNSIRTLFTFKKEHVSHDTVR